MLNLIVCQNANHRFQFREFVGVLCFKSVGIITKPNIESQMN